MSKSKLAFFPPFSEEHKWGEEEEEDGERLIVIFAFPSVWESVVSGKKEKKKKGSKLASKMVIKIFISGNSGNKEVREGFF